MLRVSQIPPPTAAISCPERPDVPCQYDELSSRLENLHNVCEEERKIIEVLDHVERSYDVESLAGELGQGNGETVPFFSDNRAARLGKIHAECYGTALFRVIEQLPCTASNIQDLGLGADVPVEFSD